MTSHIQSYEGTILICPVCQNRAFSPTAEEYRLDQIFRQWEKVPGIRISEEVKYQYFREELRNFTVYHCQECMFDMFQPVAIGTPEFYADIAANSDRYYVADKWEFSQALIDIESHDAASVLDIGCGTGYFLDKLHEKLPLISCYGFEHNSSVAAVARSKGHTVYDGPFPEALISGAQPRSYEMITLFQVLEHLSDPIGFLNAVKQLMSPNGKLIVTVPDYDGPVRHFSDSQTEVPPHHVSRWRESTFRALADRLNFRVLKSAREWLPHYLWKDYIPVMLERDILPYSVGRMLNRTKITSISIKIMTQLGIKHLIGFRGHTLYVLFEDDREPELSWPVC